MNLTKKSIITSILITLFTGSIKAQDSASLTPNKNTNKKQYNSTFFQVGIGQRNFTSVPNDVYVGSQLLDFGKGKPAMASLGGVFLPDNKGLAGAFTVDGYLGKQYGVGFNFNFGYKIGNSKFSFTPMLGIGVAKIFTPIDDIILDSAIVPAALLNPARKDAIYIGTGVKVNNLSGSNISVTASNTIFDLKPMVYLSYKISPKITLFTNIGYNINLANTSAKMEASGKGYETTKQFNNKENPVTIVTEMNTPDFLKRSNGEKLSIIPVNYSGLFIQFGMGFSGH